MLNGETLFGNYDKEQIAIERIRAYEPPEGYYLAFSGGKDSIAIKHLAVLAGVKFDAHFSNTTIEHPDTIYYVRKHHADVHFENPKKPFLFLLQTNGYPTQRLRWCCRLLKEGGGVGRLVITGIRAEESTRRAKRQMVESCKMGGDKRYLHPILDWTEDDVWQFIRKHNLPYNPLYDKGHKRVGCLFCTMAPLHQRQRDLKDYPHIVKTWIKFFEKRYAYACEHNLVAKKIFKSGEEMFYRWVNFNGRVKREGGLFDDAEK